MAALFFLSPLRYPGGKGRLTKFIGQLLHDQNTTHHTYVEPFAGGAGAALQLLYGEYVERVVLNDLDRHIAAFWRCVFTRTAELIALTRSAVVTIDEWHLQRAVFETEMDDDLAIGFATFFLNRTNRSGILSAGPIGGLEQTGTWLIDARWKADDLCRRIEILGRYRNRVTLHQDDGVNVTKHYLKRPGHLIYADPPYIHKGAGLYLDAMTWPDHVRLAKALCDAPQRSWLVTYDRDQRVPDLLFPGLRCIDFGIAHTAAAQHVGREFAVFSDGLRLVHLDGLGAHTDQHEYAPV
jgi:DNA adenine methylase